MKPEIGSCDGFLGSVLQSLSAGLANVFGQLHDICFVVGLLATVFQILDAACEITFQRGELSRLEGVRLNPPAEKFNLFVGFSSAAAALIFSATFYV